ncbi:MAG TPA: ribosome-binding factor A [Candidatus Paceibacterota bacterium]
MKHRQEKIKEAITHAAGEYFTREAPLGYKGRALVTVTRTMISPDSKKALVFLSIFPDNDEEQVLISLKRQRSAFRAYIAEQTAVRPIPTIDFTIDAGEKNRQRIDELTRR